ncbi:MAG: hypothetical protein ACRDJW_19375 [Thermomicrobiales bacterium]
MNEMRKFPPRRQWIEQLERVDPRHVAFDLDRSADILYVYFAGEPRPSIEVVVDDHVLFSVDPESEELVGLQLDGFLAHVVYELPSLLTIADDIGLSPQEVELIQQKVAPEARRRSVLEAFLGHMEPLAAAG